MIKAQNVPCLDRDSVPDENESIATDFEIDLFFPIISKVRGYLRTKEECPFARGNWIIDITFNHSDIFCIKLPIEMTEENFLKYSKPLMDKFKNNQENK